MAVGRCRKHRPDGGDPVIRVIRADSPAPGEMTHDRQAAAAERGQRRAGGTGPGHRATVCDSDLQHVALPGPPNAHLAPWQRMCVPQRVTQQFADHKGRILRRRFADSGAKQVIR